MCQGNFITGSALRICARPNIVAARQRRIPNHFFFSRAIDTNIGVRTGVARETSLPLLRFREDFFSIRKLLVGRSTDRRLSVIFRLVYQTSRLIIMPDGRSVMGLVMFGFGSMSATHQYFCQRVRGNVEPGTPDGARRLIRLTRTRTSDLVPVSFHEPGRPLTPSLSPGGGEGVGRVSEGDYGRITANPDLWAAESFPVSTQNQKLLGGVRLCRTSDPSAFPIPKTQNQRLRVASPHLGWNLADCAGELFRGGTRLLASPARTREGAWPSSRRDVAADKTMRVSKSGDSRRTILPRHVCRSAPGGRFPLQPVRLVHSEI